MKDLFFLLDFLVEMKINISLLSLLLFWVSCDCLSGPVSLCTCGRDATIGLLCYILLEYNIIKMGEK